MGPNNGTYKTYILGIWQIYFFSCQRIENSVDETTYLPWYLLYLTVTWHHSSLLVPADDYVKMKILSAPKENFPSKIKIIVCFKVPLITVLTKGLFMVSGAGWWVSRHLLLATGHHGTFSRDARLGEPVTLVLYLKSVVLSLYISRMVEFI